MSSILLFFEGIGTSEMVLIVIVILMFFGANKIPELARGLGKGIRQFKDASSEIRNEFERAGQPAPPTQPGYQPYQPAQPDPYQQPAYQPYQPHPEGYAAPPVAPTDYGTPPVADYQPPAYPPHTAPGAVTSPPAAPYPPDAPLPPSPAAGGVPGTRPRLDQSHSDA